MNPYVEIVVRTLITFAVLLVLTKLLGVKQIAQMTLFDYVVGITIGSIAGAMCMDDEIPLAYGLIALGIFILMSILIDIINRKSICGRRLFTGRPNVLIANGQIMYKGLKRSQFSVNDLLRELRVQGYFNIAEIEHAVLETSGMLSILPRTSKRPVTVEDMQLSPPAAGLVANVIIDGKLLHGNITAMDKTADWLLSELKKQGFDKLDKILLATLDDNGALSVYAKNENDEARSILQ